MAKAMSAALLAMFLAVHLGHAAASDMSETGAKCKKQVEAAEGMLGRIWEATKAGESADDVETGRKLLQLSRGEDLLLTIATGSERFDSLVGRVSLNTAYRFGDGFFLPIEVAVASGRDDFVTRLIREGADPDRRTVTVTPLIGAITLGDRAVVEALLDGGADPNLDTPLGVAIVRNEPRIVTLLLEAGADPTVENGRLLPLAAFLGNVAVANALIDGGAPGTRAEIEAVFCGCVGEADLEEACNC